MYIDPRLLQASALPSLSCRSIGPKYMLLGASNRWRLAVRNIVPQAMDGFKTSSSPMWNRSLVTGASHDSSFLQLVRCGSTLPICSVLGTIQPIGPIAGLGTMLQLPLTFSTRPSASGQRPSATALLDHVQLQQNDRRCCQTRSVQHDRLLGSCFECWTAETVIHQVLGAILLCNIHCLNAGWSLYPLCYRRP